MQICSRFFPMFLLLFLWNNPSFAQKQVVATVDGDPMYQVLPANAIPAIHNPTFVRGKQADKQMSDQEAVIGVILNGDVRAYSLWQLDRHEIVNDVVGGVPVAVTW